MQKTIPAKSKSRMLRGAKTLVAVSLACAAYASGASAQVLVHDQGVITSNQEGFKSQLAKTISQYEKQIQQYKTQLDQYTTQLQQYEQMLTSIQNIPNSVSLSSNQLEHVTNTDALIRGKCSGTPGVGGLVSTLMNSMSSLMSQSITQTQQVLCGQIVTTQIKKYNETVDMLNQLHNKYGDNLQQLESSFQRVKSLGDTDSVTAQAQKYSDGLATEMSNWQARMKADDAVIETLQNQQSILGHVALNGSSTPLGNVIQATTFAAAFH